MNTSRRLASAATAALVATLSLSACIVVPAGRRYHDDGAVVTVAPPVPQVEVYGPAPGPGYFWVGGYWNWVGGRHVWNGGRWEAPRAGYHWVPHQWHRDGNGWRAAPGHWDRR